MTPQEEFIIIGIAISFGLALLFTLLMNWFDEKYMKPWRKGTVYE